MFRRKQLDYSDEAAIALNVSLSIARNYEHEEADLSHLAHVLFMMDDSIGCKVVTEARQILAMNIDIDGLKGSIEDILVNRNNMKRNHPSKDFLRILKRRNSLDLDISSSATSSVRRPRRFSLQEALNSNRQNSFSKMVKPSAEKIRPTSSDDQLKRVISHLVRKLVVSSAKMNLGLHFCLQHDEHISLYHMFLILYEDREICNLLARDYQISKEVARIALSKIYRSSIGLKPKGMKAAAQIIQHYQY